MHFYEANKSLPVYVPPSLRLRKSYSLDTKRLWDLSGEGVAKGKRENKNGPFINLFTHLFHYLSLHFVKRC